MVKTISKRNIKTDKAQTHAITNAIAIDKTSIFSRMLFFAVCSVDSCSIVAFKCVDKQTCVYFWNKTLRFRIFFFLVFVVYDFCCCSSSIVIIKISRQICWKWSKCACVCVCVCCLVVRFVLSIFHFIGKRERKRKKWKKIFISLNITDFIRCI